MQGAVVAMFRVSASSRKQRTRQYVKVEIAQEASIEALKMGD